MRLQLNSAPRDEQRARLARSVERAIQDRCAVEQFVAEDDLWQSWLVPKRRVLVIRATVLDKLAASELDARDDTFWVVRLTLSAADYVDLAAGPVASLRFIGTVEQVLKQVATKVEDSPPTNLGRTRREVQWLAEGGQDPGPGTMMALRVRKPVGPMPEAKFWSVINRTVDANSGAFRLRAAEAARFVARLRQLADALDLPEQRGFAERTLGFLSDDVWEDVRGWLVARGQDAYGRALAHPDHVAVLLDGLESEDDLAIGEGLRYLEGTD